MKEFFKQRVQKIHRNASLYYVAKLSHAIKYLKSKLLLSCQICPVIDGRLTVECPMGESALRPYSSGILSNTTISYNKCTLL